MESTATSRREWLLLLLILPVALGLRLGNVAEPFNDEGWQQLDAFFAVMARNYVEHGYEELRFAPSTSFTPPADGEWRFYLHHPSFFPLLLSVSFHVFGVHEWSARIVPIVASLVELLAIFAITRRLFGRGAAFFATVLGACIPVTAFYAAFVCQNGPVLMACAATGFALHLRYLDRPSRGTFALMLLALLLAAANDWPGINTAGMIFLHFLRLRRFGEAALVAANAAIVPALHVLHVAWATGAASGGQGGSLVHAFWWRTWGGLDHLGGAGRAFEAIGSNLVLLYTWPVVLLAIVGLFRIRSARRPVAAASILVVGLADVLIFVEGAARHDFWNTTMAPGMLCLAGAGAVWLARRLLPSPRPAAAALTVAALAIAAHGGWRTHQRFEALESDYFEVLATVINEHTEPTDKVGTCEWANNALQYYVRRPLHGSWTDDLLAMFSPDAIRARCKVVIPEKEFAPHSHDKVFALLAKRFPHEVVETEACGKVYVFDVGPLAR